MLIDEAGAAGTLRLGAASAGARAATPAWRVSSSPPRAGRWWWLRPARLGRWVGGMLRLLVHAVGAVELTDLHRFTDLAEAAAEAGGGLRVCGTATATAG